MRLSYRLFYQPSGTVQKFMEFDKDTDTQAKEFAKNYCNKWHAKLIRLEKIKIIELDVN